MLRVIVITLWMLLVGCEAPIEQQPDRPDRYGLRSTVVVWDDGTSTRCVAVQGSVTCDWSTP